MSAPDTAPAGHVKADLVLLAATVGWGLTFAVAKIALEDSSPGVYLTARFAIGTVVAALLARGDLRDRDSVRYGALLGLLLFGAFAFNTFGLRYTSATRSGFLTSLCVVLVPLVAAAFFRQRAPGSAWAGAGLAALGLVVMSVPALMESSAGPLALLGDLLTVGSAVVYAFQILYTERFAPKVKPMAAVTVELAVVTALSALLLPFEEVKLIPTPRLAAALAFTGVFASTLFIYMQMWAQARTTAVRAAIIFSLEPLFSAVFARFIVNDPLVVETLQGGGLIVTGILVAELWPKVAARGRKELAPGP